MVDPNDVRGVAMSLPRTTEHLVAGRVKFRIGRIVYVALSPDGTSMGFAFPKEWRETFVAAEPDKFMMPAASDERYNWMRVSLAAIDATEMREIVTDAWCFVVPERVATAHLQAAPTPSADDVGPE